jgi:hypothetical protein
MSLQKNIKEIDDYNRKSIAGADKKRRGRRTEFVTRVISGDTINAKHRNNKIQLRVG